MADDKQRSKADEIRAGVQHDADVYLKRISDDMSAMRKQFDKLFTYIDRAESKIPEDFRRFCMVLHDMHDISNMYVEHGQPVPPHVLRVMELLDDAFKHISQDLEAPGGHFYRARTDIIKRGDYRYDHNQPLLAADKRKESTQ